MCAKPRFVWMVEMEAREKKGLAGLGAGFTESSFSDAGKFEQDLLLFLSRRGVFLRRSECGRSEREMSVCVCVEREREREKERERRDSPGRHKLWERVGGGTACSTGDQARSSSSEGWNMLATSRSTEL